MDRNVILVVGKGPLHRMPKEVSNSERQIRCVTNDTIERLRGLHPDMVIVKDEFISPELHNAVQRVKDDAEVVIDLRLL